MFSIFSPGANEELALVFDIGSASVGGALFAVGKSGIPKIIFSCREDIQLESTIKSNKFFDSTLKALDAVADNILSSGKGAPANIYCVLSSPWYVSQSRVIKYKKDQSFVFTSALANELIEDEIQAFKQEYSSKFFNPKSVLDIIETKNVKTVLNGYEVLQPLGESANECEIDIFVSMTAHDIIHEIQDIIHTYYNVREINFSSFTLASFASIRELSNKNDDFLLADISGETTEIVLAKKNAIRESVSFPQGRNFLIRGAAANLNCSLKEAKSCVSLFNDGHASFQVNRTMSPFVEKLKGEWLDGFKKSLSSLTADMSLPTSLYLFADDDLVSFFSDTIKGGGPYTVNNTNFEVLLVSTDFLHEFVSFESDAARDPFIMICTIYINRFLIRK